MGNNSRKLRKRKGLDDMKRKMLQKMMAAGLSAAMCAGLLAGCGSSDAPAAAETESKAEAQTEAASEGKETDSEDTAKADGEVPTLIYWTVGGTVPDDFEDAVREISDYTEEKIGVRLDVKIAGWGDYDTKMNNIINTGEYFDMMFVNNTNYSKFANLNAFEDITDLVQTETPELYNFIPEQLWKGTQLHGKVYAIPTYKDSSQTQFLMLSIPMCRNTASIWTASRILKPWIPYSGRSRKGKAVPVIPISFPRAACVRTSSWGMTDWRADFR